MKSIYPLFNLCLVSLMIISCNEKSVEYNGAVQPICVKTQKLVESQSQTTIMYPGVLTSKQVVKLSFKTGGIISSIQVNEGSLVKKGQIIASLNMTEISSQLEQSNLELEKTRRYLQRVETLYQDTIVTLEQMQDATSAYEAALENIKIAEFNQQYSRITAPADGKIIGRLAEEHELVGPGMPVLVFSAQGKHTWIVKAGLSDRDIVRIKRGDKARVEFDAFPGKSMDGYVSQITEMVDPQSGTFEVEISVDPKDEKVINGLVANVIIDCDSKGLVTKVPPEALTEVDGNKAFVYLFNESDSTASKVQVTIAYIENDHVAVLEPLNWLGSVITEGVSDLEEGTKITIMN